jgi:YrbI family 3-deoxy-D-manno-octulosonate 8-phosphate phosphatase
MRTVTSPDAPIRLFVMDVDGTLTDGTITYAADGVELKSFHARDGAGIKLLAEAGVTPAIVTGRTSHAVAHRAGELGIQTVVQGVSDKLAVVNEIRLEAELPWSAVAFMGDDLTDIPPMRHAGFSAAPSDAAPEVQRIASHVCSVRGGRGAVREAIETLLRQQGAWEAILSRLGAL